MKVLPLGWEEDQDQPGCAYILDPCEGAGICGAPRRETSSYCPQHHALCHIAPDSAAADHRLREVEAIATAVGGRRGRAAFGPSQRFLRRLERAARASSRPNRS